MGLRGIGGSPWIPKYNLSCAISPRHLTSSSLPTSNILVTVGWTPTESFSLAHHCLPPSGSIRSLEEQLPWPALLEPTWWFLRYSWSVLLYDLFYSVSIKASWICYLVGPWYLGRPKCQLLSHSQWYLAPESTMSLFCWGENYLIDHTLVCC